MQRTFERILFMIIGAFIAFLGYMVGNIDGNVNAQDSEKVAEFDTLFVKDGIIVGDETTNSIDILPKLGIFITNGPVKNPNSRIQLSAQSNYAVIKLESKYENNKSGEIDLRTHEDGRHAIRVIQNEGEKQISDSFMGFIEENTILIRLEDQDGTKMMHTRQK
ncbi:MAG: hypothetical protein OXI67_19905 [Candidatus Poribacteria bacterium]|nr:hypothetical protein [Candidatus Poribacteria bacterium]